MAHSKPGLARGARAWPGREPETRVVRVAGQGGQGKRWKGGWNALPSAGAVIGGRAQEAECRRAM